MSFLELQQSRDEFGPLFLVIPYEALYIPCCDMDRILKLNSL